MPGVELKTSVRGGHVVVALRGDLDITGAADAEAAITGLMARGQSLVIDMSALDFIDCSSLGALLRVQGLARRDGGDVMLAAPQPHVLRLLALTGNDEVFSVQASAAAAVTAIAAPRGGTFGGGLRCTLHALGGQRHRVLVPGDRGRAAAALAGSVRGRVRG
jgi:anti-anti-sigma factor